jgi:phosphonate transport system permease protein
MKDIPSCKCPDSPFPKTPFFSFLIIGALMLLILYDNQAEVVRVLNKDLADLSDYMKAPNFSSDVLSEIFFKFIETIEVALMGTLLGAAISLPLSLLASDMGGSPFVTSIVRSVLAFVRSIPMIFYALILVNITGLGAVTGTVAVMIYSLGILSKQFIDEIANLDDTVAHSIMSTGGGRFQIFWHGLLPELLPNFLSFSLLRFEINIREASVLGLVGAGGVGELLDQYTAGRNYASVWTLILFFLVIVVAIEILCRWTAKVVK